MFSRPASLALVLAVVAAWFHLVGCDSDGRDPTHSNVGTSSSSGGSGTGGDGPVGVTGELLWTISAGDTGNQYAYDATVDSQGNTLITGNYDDGIDFGGPLEGEPGASGVFLAKLDPAGQYVWAKGFTGGTGLSLAVDDSDNIWLLGIYALTLRVGGNPLPEASDLFIAKFAPDGEHLFSDDLGGVNPGNTELTAFDVAVAADGGPVVAGKYAGTPNMGGGSLSEFGGTDIFLAKLDSSGQHQFSRGFGDEAGQYSQAVATGNGVIAMAGLLRGSVDFGGGELAADDAGDAFVAVFGEDGSHRWSRVFSADGLQGATVVLVDPQSGHVFLGGAAEGAVDFGGGPVVAGGGPDLFVASFDAGGEHRWSHAYGDGAVQGLWDASLDADGNVVITGTFQGDLYIGTGRAQANGSGVFLAKIAADGTGLYVDGWSGGSALNANAVGTDGLDAVMVGEFKGSVDFGAGEHASASPDLFDIFALRVGFSE